jgi:hypothetical protein
MKNKEMSKKLEALVSKTPSKWIEESSKRFEDKEGLRYSKQKMYSEQEVTEYTEYCTTHVLKSQIGHPYLSIKQWFEQFKKK